MMFERLDDALGAMIAAMIFGAIIGMERQARGRMAGLRTNALVAIGAASFVTFSTLMPGDTSPTRVAAQVVSGVGFLGAGLIFRDGYSVHGLNTAATLWCSAAVGMLCGAGAYPIAVMLTAVVMFVNLGLRPIMYWLDRRFMAGEGAQRQANLRLICDGDRAAALRAAAVRALSQNRLTMSAIEAEPKKDGVVEVTAVLSVPAADTSALDRVVAALAGEPGLRRAEWTAADAD